MRLGAFFEKVGLVAMDMVLVVVSIVLLLVGVIAEAFRATGRALSDTFHPAH